LDKTTDIGVLRGVTLVALSEALSLTLFWLKNSRPEGRSQIKRVEWAVGGAATNGPRYPNKEARKRADEGEECKKCQGESLSESAYL